MNKIPVRGMRDILPQDMQIRDFLMDTITKVATESGYQKIETPAIEHLENLTSGDGGENEKLIFKILKRGESLKSAITNNSELTDSALRYDLTVPLSRFFAVNQSQLNTPFKALQMGPVWRADAPQKGRFRQFIQCDMDILGDSSILAEIDALSTSQKILSQVCKQAGITGLTLRINDRRLLTAAAEFAGFSTNELDSVLITLDKADKIGFEGVKAELINNNFAESVVEKFLNLFNSTTISDFCQPLNLEPEIVANLKTIMESVKNPAIKIIFDPTLVRGMGYYTGPIFEYSADGLNSSIGGGGRYDNMIGQFSGQNVPACGISIGFERLFTILQDQKFTPPTVIAKTALLISKKVPTERYPTILAQAEKLRQGSHIVSILPMARNLGRQIENLEQSGYTKIEKIYQDQA